MIKKVGILLLSAAVSSVVLASDAPKNSKKFKTHKDAAIVAIEKRIAIMKKDEECFKAAQDRVEMRACRDNSKKMRKNLKDENRMLKQKRKYERVEPRAENNAGHKKQ